MVYSGLIVFIVSILSKVTSAEQTNLFELDVEFNDTTCQGSDTIFDELVSSRVVCAKMCDDNRTCLGFSFRGSDGKCRGCTRPPESSMVDMLYFERTLRKWGTFCTEHSDCPEVNQECWANSCACVPGYKFNYTTWSCGENCSTYGTTFQKYPLRVIPGFDSFFEGASSVSRCSELCVQDQSCRSFDFDFISNICYLMDITALEYPTVFIYSVIFDYYNRNC